MKGILSFKNLQGIFNSLQGNYFSNGCCNDVDPFGVYSPFEFAYKKTGDCDTKHKRKA